MTLFIDKNIEGKTCKTCQHRQRWECGSKIIQYCGVRKSNRTQNGLLKIKAKDDACYNYKESLKKNKMIGSKFKYPEPNNQK